LGEEGTQRKFSSPQSAGFISEECPRLLENSFPHLELKIDSSRGGKVETWNWIEGGTEI